MFKKILIFFLSLGFIFSGVTAYSFWQSSLPLISPISYLESHLSSPINSNKIVYGFLPYWNLKYADQLHITDLTHLAYFAIDLNADGSLNIKQNSKELEPGWNQFNKNTFRKVLFQSKLLNQKSVVTITAMDPDVIESLLTDQSNKENALNNILDLYRQNDLDGLNIDFEHIGYPSDTIRQSFTSFIQSLKTRCQIIKPGCFVDVDVFGDTGRKQRLQNLSELNAVVDHIIVMAYDYHRKTSTQAGPVAPLRGACNQTLTNQCFDQDISTNLAEITKLVSPQKIILGIPFYGYEWQTATDQYLSNTYAKTGALASYQRIMSLFSDSKISSLSAQWSNTSLSPYLTYFEEDKLYQIHFENPQSLQLKVDLVKTANLGGLAIWALGYETPYLDLWQPLSDYLHR